MRGGITPVAAATMSRDVSWEIIHLVAARTAEPLELKQRETVERDECVEVSSCGSFIVLCNETLW